MEGLHHDTDLESTQIPGEKDFVSNEGKRAENLSQDSHSSVGSSNYSSDPVNTSLTPEHKIELYEQMVRLGDLKKDHFVPINRDILAGFFICTSGKKLLL